MTATGGGMLACHVCLAWSAGVCCTGPVRTFVHGCMQRHAHLYVPAACRSLLEPIRTSNPCVTYLEAACTDLDHEVRLTCDVLVCKLSQQEADLKSGKYWDVLVRGLVVK